MVVVKDKEYFLLELTVGFETNIRKKQRKDTEEVRKFNQATREKPRYQVCRFEHGKHRNNRQGKQRSKDCSVKQ